VDLSYCVYFHTKPNGNIFYVGIGNSDRPYDFTNSRNKIWHNIVSKHGLPNVIIVEDDISWEKACNLEKMYIKKFGRLDKGTGCLANLTDGGDGVPSWGTFEQRSAIAKKRIANTDKTIIAEHCEKMRNVRSHECMSNAAKVRWENKTVEELEKFSTVISQKAKERLSLLSKEQKSFISYKGKETMGPEGRSLAAKKGKQSMTPEQRSEAVRKSWITRKQNKNG
jgi:hypothetical protein